MLQRIIESNLLKTSTKCIYTIPKEICMDGAALLVAHKMAHLHNLETKSGA